MGPWRIAAKRIAAILAGPLVTAGILLGIHLFAGGSSPRSVPQPVTETRSAAASCAWQPSLIGTVRGPGVQARAAPSAAAPVIDSFGARNAQGNRQVFLLVGM